MGNISSLKQEVPGLEALVSSLKFMNLYQYSWLSYFSVIEIIKQQ